MTGPYSVRPWWNRRGFLKGSVAAAAGAYGLSSYFATAAPVPEKFDGSAFKLKAPEPNAKSGGVLRHGMPLRAPHFDIHQAGTIFILGAAACMFDNLIRRDPNDGANTIIPDLAHSWGMPRMARPTRSIFARACNSKHRGLADTLPFPDAGFDYVLSWNVIHHGTLGDLGRRLGEIWRVLRPAGLLQATVLSTRDANYGIGRAIAPDTFVIDQVERKGHPHCYCDAATLVGLLAGFDLLTLSQQLQERRPGSHHWHTSPNAAAESDLRGKSTVWRLVTLGVLGAVVVTLGSGLQNDIYFQVGLLTTVRLAAKNVILIVDFARERFDHGSTPAEAAVHAAKERLRPILMTSFAFISEHCRWPWRPAPAQAPMWPSARRWSAAWSV